MVLVSVVVTGMDCFWRARLVQAKSHSASVFCEFAFTGGWVQLIQSLCQAL